MKKRLIGVDMRTALRRIVKRGRAGATAREIAQTEAIGLSVGAKLVEVGLVMVTRENRFVHQRYALKRLPATIQWDDDEKAGRIAGPNG